MDDRPDPIAQFFPDQDPDTVDLYGVLNLTNIATPDDIKKSYRKLALIHHPDKHSTAAENAKAATALKFQQIGFAYAVLGDDKRRQRYDKTGRTDEGLDFGAEDGGWEAYFEELFDKVTKEKLDDLKKEYQGSVEEVEDLKAAYVEHDGSIDTIMMHIPHSTFDDEARFIVIISEFIKKGELPKLKTWEKSIKDEKAKLVRKKQGKKEAAEAEELAKDLGVWDEFYGSDKPTARKNKGKGKEKKGAEEEEEGEEDTSALQALILKKRKNMDGFFDSLAAKYAEPQPSTKGKGGKRRVKGDDDDNDDEKIQVSPKKRSRKEAVLPPPEIDDEEFEKLQAKLFPTKDKEAKPTSKDTTAATSSSPKKRAAKGKKSR